MRQCERCQITLPQGHPQVGLVSEWKWGGTNTVKASDCVVEGSECVGERGSSGGGKVSVPQQKGIVTIEVHDDL